MLGVGVANLGVGGYGPEQALLKFEGLIDRFPRAGRGADDPHRRYVKDDEQLPACPQPHGVRDR
jgi:hypothetical protein